MSEINTKRLSDFSALCADISRNGQLIRHVLVDHLQELHRVLPLILEDNFR